MAINALSRHFQAFSSNINPADTYEQIAASEHTNIRRLLEDPQGPAGELAVKTFLQGSYLNDTSIHSINDVDLVGLCTALRQPGSGTGPGWPRDVIFETFAKAVAHDQRYRGKIQFGPTSMCVKLDIQIKVEILPAVMKAGTDDDGSEPFRMWDPAAAEWVDGYAREHRRLVSDKNGAVALFKPIIKTVKHLRDIYKNCNKDDAISFHLECLLYAVVNSVYDKQAADALPAVALQAHWQGSLH